MNIINCKNQKGITLIALIVTIIVVLIIAGISLNGVLDKKGTIREANDRMGKGQKESLIEKIEADLYNYKTINGKLADKETLISIIENIDSNIEVSDEETDNPTVKLKDKDGEYYDFEIKCKDDIIGWENNY